MKLLISITLFFFAVTNALICNENTTSVVFYDRGADAFPDLRNCSSHLTLLDLSNNQIQLVPPEIGTFVNLEELILNNNYIQELPAEIGNLPNLRVLWVNNNRLNSLPSSIGQLQNLRVLRIEGNSLEELPSEIGNLYRLEELYAGQNNVHHLPSQISWLGNLITLSVPSSNLTEIPAEFGYLHNLQTLEVNGNPLTCLPRSVKRLPNIYIGNYLPACTNHTVEAFLTNRTAQKGTCEGFASSINGTALGCFDYVHTSCSMTSAEVTVTTRRLSDMSSEGLSCALDAPLLSMPQNVTYPRCDPKTGASVSCGGPNADNNVHRRDGLVTLRFDNWESCNSFDIDVAPTRRLSASDADSAAVVLPAAVAAAPSLHRPQRAAPSLSAYKATKEAALSGDEQVRRVEVEARMAALNATDPEGPAGPACNASTTFYYVGYNASVDLSPCHQSLTELVVLSVDFALIAPQIKHMVNLQLLKIYYTWNTILPEELADLKQLTRLETYGTSFNGWHELDVLQRMPQLRHLVLSGASLWYQPYWLGKLRNLEHLDVSYNNIYEIGDEIGGLVKLQTLIAPFSFVQSVSPRINRLTHLHHLDLRDSYYLRLPATLAELNELESVQLEGSYYPCVPDAVRAMPVMANTHYFDYTLSCAAVPQPIGYAQTRNDACLWDAYYGFWYKAACDGAKNKLFVTMYADAGCTHQAKRKAAHALYQFAPVGYCSAHYGFNGTMTASYTYCHN